MDKNRLLEIIRLEKKRLDNRSIVGGFDRFVRTWGYEAGEPGWSETAQILQSYGNMPVIERKRIITKLEKTISEATGSGKPVPDDRVRERELRSPVLDNDPNQTVRNLKGVGPVLERTLYKLGLRTVRDMLYYFPRTYRDRGDIIPISNIATGRLSTIEAVVSAQRRVPTRRKPLLKISLTDGYSKVNLVCFNQDYLAQVMRPGKKVRVTGTFIFRNGSWETSDFEYELIDTPDSRNGFSRIVPIYPLTEGLTQKKIRAVVCEAIKQLVCGEASVLPTTMVEKYQLWPKPEAIRELHQPNRSRVEDLIDRTSPAHRTIIFEEYLMFALALKLRRKALKQSQAKKYRSYSFLVERFRKCLPFRLTDAQERVFQEIVADLSCSVPMSRLVQGDVGSGKTLIALLASLQVIGEESQAALMVPTEILAEQHYGRWAKTLEQVGVTVGLLRGGPGKEKDILIENITKNKIDLVIGTHALIQETVAFADLGLVIVDEQHRFGVAQRSRLQAKANMPHVLVMTATPIPRTLALTLYGDLDISVVDQKPAGRKTIETVSFSEQERYKAYNRVAGFLARGHQAFVVCPAIEENDDEMVSVERIAEELNTRWLKENRIAIIHGRLPSRDKEKIMHRFVSRDIDVLVATSVIEVGVDIPTANVMVVEQADRFGLAQLHQLRGRIGRGTSEALCILLTRSQDGPACERTKIMTTTNDGFVIAEEDLKMRGPGEFFGFRQHGVAEFNLAEPYSDWVIFEQVVTEAENILSRDPDLSFPEHAVILRAIRDLRTRHPLYGDLS